MTEIQRHFLLPGDIAFASQHANLSTLLGSCVAVCLHDEKRRMGGMNHFMLPSHGAGGPRVSKGKYGEYAIPRLVAMAERAGCTLSSLTAQVFGGGHVAGHLGSMGEVGLYNVSDRNVITAEVTLRQLGVKIIRRDTGGTTARKIHMDTATGEVLLTHVQKSADNVERARKIQEFKSRKIGVLVVDDSKLVRTILGRAIEASGDMEVIGEAADPFEAREQILQQDPDVISLDIIMPRMDGLTFLRKLMRYKYVPTVVVSTTAKKDSAMVQKVLDAGAVAAVDKDALAIYQGPEVMEREYLPKLRMAATMVRNSAQPPRNGES